MDQFVRGKRLEGTSEAEGSFTLNPEKAREKLREYQLLQPGSYLLKVVQAAVSVGVTEIEVGASRDDLTLSFESKSESLPTPRELHRYLSDGAGNYSRRSAIHALTVAINGAQAEGIREICWETPTAGLQVTPKGITEFENRSKRWRFVVRKERTLKQWFLGTVYLDEICQLHKRCQYGPQKMILDSRVLQKPLWDHFGQAYRDDIGLNFPAYLLESWRAGNRFVVLRPPPQDYYLDFRPDSSCRLWDHDHRCQDLQGKEIVPLILDGVQSASVQGVSLAFAVRPSFHQQSVLLLVRDGVLLDTVKGLDLGHPGVVAIVESGDLNTDISEFRFVRDEAFETLVNSVRDFVCSRTEKVTEDQLKATMVDLQDPTSVARVLRWLHTHQLPQVQDVADLVWRHFPSTMLHRHPSIPRDQILGARSTYRDILPRKERILALYDDGMVGKSEVGFVITERRICWKNTLAAAQSVFWQELAAFTDGAAENLPDFIENKVPTILKPELKQHVFSFLKAAREFDFGPLPDTTKSEWELCLLGLHYFGKSEGIYYHPAIPEEKLKEAIKNFPDLVQPGNRALVFYDDTFFGSGDNGFVVTEKAIYWRNVFSNSTSVEWPNLHQCALELNGSEVRIDGEPITIFREELRAPALSFLQEMARSVDPEDSTGAEPQA